MFREMRRKKQAIDETACLEILKKEKRGVLCMTADGWPYGIPMDHVLLDGKLYFHCAKAGKKLEALREDDRVCYTVTGEGDPAIDALVLQRYEAKKAKNFAEADRIRDQLKSQGIEITDRKDGASWKRV